MHKHQDKHWFFSRVNKLGPWPSDRHLGRCWLLGTNSGVAQGSVTVNHKCVKASRYAFQLFKGRIPFGLFVLHRCDHPGCSRPSHLYLGTHQQNMNDMKQRNRRNFLRKQRVRLFSK